MGEAKQGQGLTSSRSKWSAESLQEEAYRLLHDFQTAALNPDGSEVDRIKAETAKLIVEIGEKKAGLMDREAAKSKIAEMQKYGEQLIATLTEDVKNSIAAAGKGSEQAAVAQLLKRSLKSLEAKREEFATSLDQHAWKAWDEACQELLALRTGCILTGKQGEA